MNSWSLGSVAFFFRSDFTSFEVVAAYQFCSGISTTWMFTLLGLILIVFREFVLSLGVFTQFFFSGFFYSFRLALDEVKGFLSGDSGFLEAVDCALGTLLEVFALEELVAFTWLVFNALSGSFLLFLSQLFVYLAICLALMASSGCVSLGWMICCCCDDASQPIQFYYQHRKPYNRFQIRYYNQMQQNNAPSEQASAVNIQHSEPNAPIAPSLLERYGIRASKVFKLIAVMLVVGLLVLVVMQQWQTIIINGKKMFKKGTSEAPEISALDQTSYRTYYHYKNMVNISKNNKLEGKKFDPAIAHQFDDVTFPQLFGIFKVVKAIQHAKNYSSFPSKTDEQSKQLGNNVDPQLLQKPYNYTEYFWPAANQYQCGSCYSFPIAATIEYIFKKFKGISVKLSEQQLIDCSAEDETVDGCSAGNITKGFQYATKVGLVAQQDYPYRSKNGHSFDCRKEIVDNPQIKKYKIDGFRNLPKDNCMSIQNQLSKGNVVASMINAGQLSSYTQIETSPFRNCPKQGFNHAITIVGQTAKQQWIIRNSWGSSWGKNGYFIMRGGNTCGVCTYAIVPFFST